MSPVAWAGTKTRAASRPPLVHWEAAGSGQPVLLLNGWSASGSLWPRAWLRDLEGRFQVIRIDNRGTGWSRSAPRPFTMGQLADDAVAVLDALGLGRATVVGLSMGGMIAQELTLRHPTRVSRLVIVASRPPAPEHCLGDTRVLTAMMQSPARGEGLRDYFKRLWTANCVPGFADAHPELIDELVEQLVERPTPRTTLYDQMRAIAAWGGAHRLGSIDVPTRVIHGELDPIVPLINGMRLARAIPGAHYAELRGVGHLVPLEAGARLTELLGSHVA